ncbi:MAG: type II toxin-antitoxin system RelE/ParE family toxin [Thermomicrobiales bacterium]
MGRIRFDIASDVRSIPVGQHVIYYHPTEDAIIIRRIVHGRRDVHVDLDE